MPLPRNDDPTPPWRDRPDHQAWLRAEAERQVRFFRPSLRRGGAFAVLDHDGNPLPGQVQELHTTTRLVHSYALAAAAGMPGTDDMIEAGMARLWSHHRDARHGGYVWSTEGDGVGDGTKLAYGHVFVLLAGASAKSAGHPDADRLIADVTEIIDRHFWDEPRGLLRDEYTRDWQPFSTYRGMNANMHGIEALLTAFEATGERQHLDRAGRILDFFVGQVAPAHGWHIPEHYDENWRVDRAYRGNPMFRPPGTTPGHSFELGRLALQHWDLTGRADPDAPDRARMLIETALAAAWLPQGGFAYTLGDDRRPLIADRYWWPVSEAIGAVSALQKLGDVSRAEENDEGLDADEAWYRRLWTFADAHLIDRARGGWFPELDDRGRPTSRQFTGKPDIYHSLQAALLPQVPGISRLAAELRNGAR